MKTTDKKLQELINWREQPKRELNPHDHDCTCGCPAETVYVVSLEGTKLEAEGNEAKVPLCNRCFHERRETDAVVQVKITDASYESVFDQKEIEVNLCECHTLEVLQHSSKCTNCNNDLPLLGMCPACFEKNVLSVSSGYIIKDLEQSKLFYAPNEFTTEELMPYHASDLQAWFETYMGLQEVAAALVPFYGADTVAKQDN